jgi:hypothetical protein
VVHEFASGDVLLVGYGKCGCICCEEFLERGGVWDGFVVAPQGDVLHSELDCVSPFLCAHVCVFSNA